MIWHNILYHTVLHCITLYYMMLRYAKLYHPVLYHDYNTLLFKNLSSGHLWTPWVTAGLVWVTLVPLGSSGGNATESRRSVKGGIEGWWIPWGNPKKPKKSKLYLKKHSKTIGETQKKQKKLKICQTLTRLHRTHAFHHDQGLSNLWFFLVFLGFSNGFAMLFAMQLWFFWFFGFL